MIRHDVKQGSAEWLQLRAGIPTASCFDQILTPAKLEPSKSAEAYMNRLVAERIIGMPLDTITTALMDRGTHLESEARDYYAMIHGVEFELVGFCSTGDGRAGASPDAFVGEDGILEIKCPKPENHVAYMFAAQEERPSVERAYWLQVQGQLWVTGRKWCDVLSYCPGLPHALVRVEADAKAFEALNTHIVEFCDRLDAKMQQAKGYGWLIDDTAPMGDRLVTDWLQITDADVDAMLARTK